MQKKYPQRSGFVSALSGDFSVWSLFLSNIAIIALLMKNQMSISTVLWTYWIQSVMIGVFNFIKILALKEFSAEGVRINGMKVSATTGVKLYTAFFFLFHYGFFHLVYAVFIFSGESSGLPDKQLILYSALIFFINHLFSFMYHKDGENKLKNIGQMMFFPYIRIIPMHIAIVFGLIITPKAILLFMALKTAADISMHLIEHASGGALTV